MSARRARLWHASYRPYTHVLMKRSRREHLTDRRVLPLTQKGDRMEQPPHPKGALTFMLIYLVVLSLFWLNSFLRLWLKG